MKTQKQILAMLLLASALITASCGSGDTTASDTDTVATEAQTSAENAVAARPDHCIASGKRLWRI